MTDLRIVYHDTTGQLVVVQPSESSRRRGKRLVDGKWVDWVEPDDIRFARTITNLRSPTTAHRIPDGVDPVILHKDQIPADEFYRAARKLVGGRVEWDMPRAREMHRERLRKARVKPLADLDVEVVRALETGAPTTEIVARKKKLRDAPADPRIDQATTLEELKAVWPLTE